MLLKLIIFSAFVAAATSSAVQVVRPCKLNDYDCIACTLAANFKCNRQVLGSLPQRYVVRDFNFEAPYFNSSYVENTVIITNHNLCHISEFFIDPKDGVIVVSVDCPDFEFEAKSTVTRHDSMEKDKQYNFINKASYPLIRMTANLNPAKNLDLCSAFVFTDVTTLPRLHVDPLDKPTANFLSRDLTLLNIFERESFFYKGFKMFRKYIMAYVCDFGCPDISFP